MISTIFYFADTEQEYLENYSRCQVKPYTIVFCKDTRSLWKNGVRYGGSTKEEIEHIVDDTIEHDVKPIIDDINDAVNTANGIANELYEDALQALNELRNDADLARQDAQDEKDRLNSIIDRIDLELNENGQVLEWIYAGLTTDSDDNKSFSELVNAAKSGDHTAISNITQLVTPIKDDNGNIISYRAKQFFTSAVDDALSGILNDVSDTYANSKMISSVGDDVAELKTSVDDLESRVNGIAANGNLAGEFVAQADFNSAMASLRAGDANSGAIGEIKTTVQLLGEDVTQVKNSMTSVVDDTISTLEQKVLDGEALTAIVNKADVNSNNISAIVSKITGDESSVDVTTKIGNMKSGLVSQADLNSATSGLISTDDLNDTSSTIYTRINKAAGDAVAAMEVEGEDGLAAKIIATVGKEGSSVTLNADLLNFEGQSNFDSIISQKVSAAQIEQVDVDGKILSVLSDGNATFIGDIKANSLTAGREDELHIVTKGNTILFMNGDIVVGRFVIEGQGLQLYILGEDGLEYKINWENWNPSQGFDPKYIYIVDSDPRRRREIAIYKVGDVYYSLPKTGDQYKIKKDFKFWLNEGGGVTTTTKTSDETYVVSAGTTYCYTELEFVDDGTTYEPTGRRFYISDGTLPNRWWFDSYGNIRISYYTGEQLLKIESPDTTRNWVYEHYEEVNDEGWKILRSEQRMDIGTPVSAYTDQYGGEECITTQEIQLPTINGEPFDDYQTY